MDPLIAVATEFFKTGTELHVKQLKAKCDECEARDSVIEALSADIELLRAHNKCLEEDIVNLKARGIDNARARAVRSGEALAMHRRAVETGLGMEPCFCGSEACERCAAYLKPGWIPSAPAPAPPAPSEP